MASHIKTTEKHWRLTLNQPDSALSSGQTDVYERPVLVPPQNVQARGLPLGHVAMHWNALEGPKATQCTKQQEKIFSKLQFLTTEFIFCLFEDARMRVMEDRGRGDLLHYY